jgi:hypothetical protein
MASASAAHRGTAVVLEVVLLRSRIERLDRGWAAEVGHRPSSIQRRNRSFSRWNHAPARRRTMAASLDHRRGTAYDRSPVADGAAIGSLVTRSRANRRDIAAAYPGSQRGFGAIVGDHVLAEPDADPATLGRRSPVLPLGRGQPCIQQDRPGVHCGEPVTHRVISPLRQLSADPRPRVAPGRSLVGEPSRYVSKSGLCREGWSRPPIHTTYLYARRRASMNFDHFG